MEPRMRSRDLLRLSAVAVLFVACAPAVEKPPVLADATPVPAAPSVAAVAEKAPAPTAATVAGPAAPVVDVAPLPVAPDALAKLPPGAAAYFSARVSAFSKAVASGAVPQEILRDFMRGFGARTPDELITTFGLDPRRPVLGAMVGASEKSARPVVEAIGKDGSSKSVEKAMQAHAKDVTLLRLLVPLANGKSPAVAAAALVKAISRGSELGACPGAAACAGFGADAPLGVAQGSHLAIAAYADGSDLRVDVAMPLFVEGTDPGVIAALVPFRASRGGPVDRCSRFEPSATLSICVDAVAFGDDAAAHGYGKTVQAVAGASVDASQRSKIARVGAEESRRNVELASPARRLAEDGTMVIDLQAQPNTVMGTWALTKASRPAVEKAFATERCAAGQAVLGELVPALRAAFGDPGPGFTDPKKTLNSFREAGWGAFGVTLAGTWPNLIDGFLAVKGEVPAAPSALRVCARVDAGRLVLGVK
jgi:hypothetical protein